MTQAALDSHQNFIYSPLSAAAIGAELQREILNFLPGQDVPLCQSVHCLAFKLLSIPDPEAAGKTVGVLIITDERELEEIFEFRELLEQANLIFMLPSNDTTLAQRVSELKPRKITFYNQEYSSVVEEILSFRNLI